MTKTKALINNLKDCPNLQFYPSRTLIQLWRKGQITTKLLKELVKADYLPKGVKQ